MKIFKEMVTLVTKQKAARPDILDMHTDSESLYVQLFKGIAEGRFRTDEEAALALYQARPSHKKYQMLKSRLKDRVVNTLFFINHKKNLGSPYLQAVYQCNRSYFCAKLLLINGARNSGTSMAKSALALSEKFDLNELTLLCARMLRHHYALEGREREYKRLDKIVSEAMHKIKAENKAEYMLETLQSYFARSKEDRPELASIARQYFLATKELSKYQKSFHLTILYYRIGTLYYQIIKNYKLLLHLCNMQQQYLHKNPRFFIASGEGEIALLKMVCCLHLHKFQQGKLNAEAALKQYKAGSNNWFVVMENYFMLSMHAGHFEQAAFLLEQVMHHSRFHLQLPVKQETWKIFEAYIHYLLPNRPKSKEFKLAKFMNEVPIISKDKAGFYPAVLIAQIFFLLNRWDDDKLERNIESLRVFASRYSLIKKAPRTAIFIKMLRQLINFNYNLKKVEKRVLPYLAELKTLQGKAGGGIDNMEILPYEKAWEIITLRLQKRK